MKCPCCRLTGPHNSMGKGCIPALLARVEELESAALRRAVMDDEDAGHRKKHEALAVEMSKLDCGAVWLNGLVGENIPGLKRCSVNDPCWKCVLERDIERLQADKLMLRKQTSELESECLRLQHAEAEAMALVMGQDGTIERLTRELEEARGK